MILDNVRNEKMKTLEPVLRGLEKIEVIERKNGRWVLTSQAEEIVEVVTPADVSRCLANGANIEARDEDGKTPLHWAAREGESLMW